MLSLLNSGAKALRLMKETICWQIRSISLSLLGLLPPRGLPSRYREQPETLQAEIKAAQEARKRAEAKLLATRELSAEVSRLVNDWGN